MKYCDGQQYFCGISFTKFNVNDTGLILYQEKCMHDHVCRNTTDACSRLNGCQLLYCCHGDLCNNPVKNKKLLNIITKYATMVLTKPTSSMESTMLLSKPTSSMESTMVLSKPTSSSDVTDVRLQRTTSSPTSLALLLKCSNHLMVLFLIVILKYYV